jgi:hypothetical protein
MRPRHSFSLLGAAALMAAGCDGGSVVGNVTASADGAHTVNGSIQVPAGLHSGAVGTVNGSIHVGDNAVVGSANTVNGGIDMGAHASVESATTVNGSVTLASGAHVAHSVTSVNGSMNLGSDADVGGAVRNVNGHIALTAAHVGGGLSTVGGDIDISGASRVEGGITVERGNSWFGLRWESHKPRIVIGPGAVVQGSLRFERDVQLYVSDQATIGPVTGATPVRFSGSAPPG